MISTNCGQCVFNDGSSCSLNQFRVIDHGTAVAPGVCRLCRTKTQSTPLDVSLKVDLLVCFDEQTMTHEDLAYTLDNKWYKPQNCTQKILIADTCGFAKNRGNIALKCVKQLKSSIPIVVDSSVSREKTSDCHKTIYRIAHKLSSPFFLVLPAGARVRGFNRLRHHIQRINSRAIHWKLPFVIKDTFVTMKDTPYGLYASRPYYAVSDSNSDDCFDKQLMEEKNSCSNIELSMLLSNCWIETRG